MSDNLIYVGFWARVVATLIDSVLLSLIIMPLLIGIYGMDAVFGLHIPDDDELLAMPALGIADILISYVMPVVLVLLLWFRFQATPGKMLFGAKIVDANTGGKPSVVQFILRYIGYIPSFLIFGLGVFWVAFDKRKQGWHDKLASTVVVRDREADKAEFSEHD